MNAIIDELEAVQDHLEGKGKLSPAEMLTVLKTAILNLRRLYEPISDVQQLYKLSYEEAVTLIRSSVVNAMSPCS